MSTTIIGNKAVYFIDSINSNGDMRISMTGHKEYIDCDWIVGNYDYMSSIKRIESGDPMHFERR